MFPGEDRHDRGFTRAIQGEQNAAENQGQERHPERAARY